MTDTHTPTHQNHHPEEGQLRNLKQTAERCAFLAAGVVIVALTASGFWLSYAHLAEVAGQHGLGGSPARQWAWPATLDAFIVAGELLMLRAGLRGVTDHWAIALTASGSLGSIALNVAGVSGTGVALLDYVVAAVPPAAALLAFAVLMRQIHQLVDHPTSHPAPAPVQTPQPATPALVQPTEPPAAVPDRSAEPDEIPETRVRGGRPAKATVEELVDIGRTTLAEHGTLSRSLLRRAVTGRGLSIGNDRQTEVMKILRPEIEAAARTGAAST
ncbi:DUF2637 domain-containing protein [Streptomyces alkaliphilus]|uniref:DUF2637 domain-containing protein n=1 Tax=Streptomyces alkaliphilus TaxID=1472722 RepID=UPI001180387B|nr:DUF2637 domain-containing protein [Streptomyces alkaliphilus]MQS05709.1 DUF2637 domain-containing protein [Streptomyces alkaliphilus]